MTDAAVSAQHTDFPTPPPDLAPTRETPDGPIWIIDGDDGALRLRRLPTVSGLLKLGATLRHTGSASHPRLQSPNNWWLDSGHIWLATSLPSGELLFENPPRRLTWSSAIEALTPLAIALKRAHRRGLVHARIAPWNVVFDAERHHLTVLDFGTWPLEPPLNTPYFAPEIQDEAPNPTPATDVHNLARLLVYLAITPEQARRSRPSYDTIPAYAISTIERALDADAGRRPQTIDEFLAGITFHPRDPFLSAHVDDEASHSAPSSTAGRVAEIELFDHPRRGEGIRFRLHTADAADPPGAFVYQEQRPDLFGGLQHLWEGAELGLHHPRLISDSSGRVFLTATERTLPVFEPHWPVSVSDVLKARGCPQRVMVDRRDPGERTHHLAFGTLVHQFLEDLTAHDRLTFEEAVERRLPPLRLDFLAAGVDDKKLAELLSDARRHFEHLRRFTGRRTLDASRTDRVGWSGEHAEATRYSSRYGLEGRTDLVVTDPDEGLQIIELKSGKPWHDHPGQVQSYALLWRTLADRRDLPTSGHLLYSKNGHMTRVSLEGGADEQALMRGRNELVTLFRSYIDDGLDYRPPHYMEKPRLCRQNACRFRKKRCRAQTELLGFADADDRSAWPDADPELVRLARRYHHHMTRLVEAERWAAHAALGAIFQKERLPERIADGCAATELSLHRVDGAPDRARLVGAGLHVFSPGDRILLHRGDVDAHHVLRATVLGRPDDGDGLDIALRAAELTDQFVGPGWTADALPSRIGFHTAHRALYRILESRRTSLLNVLVRPHLNPREVAAKRSQRSPHRATTELLDDAQLQALHHALQPRQATLIQGPPGTGKTTTIAHLCSELARGGQSVLLAALTNTAVDTMLIKLLDAADDRGEAPPRFLRLGSSERSPRLAQALEDRGLDGRDHFSDDLARSCSSLKTLALRLDAITVVATTAHSSIRHPVITHFENRTKGPAFDVALVDEASQLTEPLALAPISTAKRFVLVGDHRQLPPIVTSERALSTFLTGDGVDGNSPHRATISIPDALRKAGIAGLDKSLFERLAGFLTPHMLTTQYRMNRQIMAFPAETFYDGRLIAHHSVADHTLDLGTDDHPAPLSTDSPVVFVDVDGTAHGRTNPDEARALIECAEHILRCAPSTTIGALSPFRAQVHLLRRLYQNTGTDGPIDVDTVERFQGNERDVILASLVKTDHPGEFLAAPRRLNVAFTRARKKLIVFGSRSCVEQNPLFRHWLASPYTTIVEWK